VDAILILVLRRKLPEMTALPDLGTKRQKVDLDDPLGAVGITPFFAFAPRSSDVEAGLEDMEREKEQAISRLSVLTTGSLSGQPLKPE
jgi:hypothetical protein